MIGSQISVQAGTPVLSNPPHNTRLTRPIVTSVLKFQSLPLNPLKSGPAHAREIRRVLVASMDFRAPRVRPRIFPYTPGFVLAVHVQGNLRPAHLACVGEWLTIRGQHRNEPANRQEEGLSESSEKKERKATAVTQKRARLEANRQTAHPGSDLKARAPTTQAGPAALPPGVHPAPSTPLRPDCDHNRHQHHAIPQTDMGHGGSDFSGAGQRSPGAGRGVPVVGAVGSREREQQGPGMGPTATHGAVHGHFLPCTGMYRDRVRAYNVQYTTCTQKVVHFRECTGHVRDWTRFVCRPARKHMLLRLLLNPSPTTYNAVRNDIVHTGVSNAYVIPSNATEPTKFIYSKIVTIATSNVPVRYRIKTTSGAKANDAVKGITIDKMSSLVDIPSTCVFPTATRTTPVKLVRIPKMSPRNRDSLKNTKPIQATKKGFKP
ncbi:hypothetical protein Bbelb_150140 [Branchiostoma belcheri]|nr:hypothetical protein Bbelb_150140 [Branchiostoma belcheri]